MNGTKISTDRRSRSNMSRTPRLSKRPRHAAVAEESNFVPTLENGNYADRERVAKLREREISFSFCQDFDVLHPDVITADLPDKPKVAPPRRNASRSRSTLQFMTADVARMCSVALLSHDDEIHLFRKMNYYRYLAARKRDEIHAGRAVPLALVLEIEHLLDKADEVRNEILRANLRLVISIAKQYVNGFNTFEELVSEGNLSLLRAAEKYNFALGNRFSTYATRAIRNNLFHYVSDKHRYRGRFPVAEEKCLQGATDTRANARIRESSSANIQKAIRSLIGSLDSQTRKIVEARFGLAGKEPRTLKSIASETGVSRERVRQIEARAIRAMRLFASERHINIEDDLDAMSF
ncbi:MAG: sigma-70 family RNA polymerase sigma factor [Planctomycetota bacterium]